ncbi:Neuronal acetylcholine receptor subunit alpha-4 [Clonorchis sinensis]|uniref:Neuronal acetylcholine receptor subunit alpha-4 n=1 Tax=Clonorchis sinensis TaxID=79923 RepID=A0A8T1M2U2_CLOSI|nr:Neuronal acetylcholine receptor subunit alpha-4 [Clonorchis sinensis]
MGSSIRRSNRVFSYCKQLNAVSLHGMHWRKNILRVLTLSDEKRLIKRLLKNYEDAGITGRPVINTEEVVKINMSLSLIQILDLDEKNQVLTISVWLLFNWNDHILTWDPNNYSQVVEVRVPAKQIWTPDIVLYNYADERLKEMRDAMVVVQYDGSIKWMPPAIFKSNCKIDIKSFPFDEQTCHMKFGSWTYDGNRLDVSFISDEKHVLLNDYTESNEWEIIARPAMRNVKYYPCCVEPYPDLTYFLFLRRNAAFFSYILVLPCVLLSSLTLVIFWLPPESPAKMVLGMNIFVAFFLLLLLLADSTPQASTSVPYIGYYYCLNMILITLSSFLSVIVINLYFRGDRRNRVPRWIIKICYILTRTKSDGADKNNNKTNKDVAKDNTNEVNYKADGSKTAMTTEQLAPFHLAPGKSILSPSGNRLETNGNNETIVMQRRTKRPKTRFAPTKTITSNFETILTQDTSLTIPNAHQLNQEEEACVHQRQRRVRLDPNDNETKGRSRSWTPAKSSFEINSDTLEPLFRAQEFKQPNNLTECNDVCQLCRPCVATMDFNSPYPTEPRSPSQNMMSGSRHQRHPQTCQVCQEHLNALRSQRPGSGNPSPPNTCLSQTLFCNHPEMGRTNQPSSNPTGGNECTLVNNFQASHNFQRGLRGEGNVEGKVSSTTVCHPLCGQVQYAYQDGRLVLVPQLRLTTSICTKPEVVDHKLSDEFKTFISPTKLSQSLEEEVQEIRKVVRTFLSRVSKKDTENVILREWRMVALVLDRIFFLSYLVIHLCAAIGLLIPSSHEANVIGFMRDYRLKNYNATFTDEEAAALSPLALRPFDRAASGAGVSPDREENVDSIVPVGNVEAVTKPSRTSTSEDSSLLSPYQRLVDKHGEPNPDRPVTGSFHQYPQSDPQQSPKTSGSVDRT